MPYIEEINTIIEKLQKDENNAVYADDFVEINSIIARAQADLDERQKMLDESNEKIKGLQEANYNLLQRAIVKTEPAKVEEEEKEEISLDDIDI